ncbi:MAG: glycosyltransferase family 39 protein [Patescibacteria group bacterium]
MKAYIFLILIIVLSAFLRFYNLGNIYVFNFDEEYQATYAWTQVLDLHPIWIGVSASFLDFYMGPLFTYITAFFLAISKGDPLITAYIAALTGTLTSIVIFFIGWRLFNLTTGFIAGLLYAGLPLFVFYDQKYWNPMFAPLIVLLIFITLNLVHRSKWWWICFAALVGLIFETELAPIPVVLIGMWYFFKKGYWKDIKLVFFCLVTFLLLYWPLLIFDINHNFSNITVLTRLQEQISKAQITFNPETKLHSLFDSLGRFWYLKAGNSNADEINISCSSLSVKEEFKFIDRYAERTYAPFWLSLVSLAGILLFLFTGLKSKKRPEQLLAICILTLLISYFIYPGGSFEYHNLGLFALLTFIPGIFISKISKQYRLIFIALVIFVIALGLNTVLNASDKFGLGSKKILILKVMDFIGEKTFSIEGRGICHNWEGWRYLFKIYGRVPYRSYTDQNFGWLYPDEIKTGEGEYTVILSEDRLPLKANLNDVPFVKVGGYKAYIRKNMEGIQK